MATPALDLLVAYAGTPSTPPLSLSLPLTARSLVVFGAADTVVLLEASTLRLVNTLVFWEAFPSSSEPISAVAVDPRTRLIAAAVGTRVALWTVNAKDEDSWRIHSTLVLPDAVTCIDLHTNQLCVGTTSGLSVFSLDASGDLLSWKLVWSAKSPAPSTLCISPSASHIASTSSTEKYVRVYSTRTKRQIQKIAHPHPVARLKWRMPPAKYIDEICLYTMTPDSVVRVFMTVIDAPNHLQLHAALDRWSFLPGHPDASTGEDDDDESSRRTPDPVFWIDRAAFLSSKLVQETGQDTSEVEQGRRRKLKDLVDDDWELFGFITRGGCLIVRALTNLDKRPPTLLRQFTFFHTPSQVLHPCPWLLFVPSPTSPPSSSPSASSSSSRTLSNPVLITTSPLRTHQLSVLPLIDGAPEGLKRISRAPRAFPRETVPIEYFVRSPDGSAVVSRRKGGGGEIYTRDRRGTFHNRQSWTGDSEAIVLLNAGRGLAVYTDNLLTVHLYDRGSHEEIKTLSIPHNPPSTPSLLVITVQSQDPFPHPTPYTYPSSVRILSVTPSSISTFLLSALDTQRPSLTLILTSTLPLPSGVTPSIVMPVDPMAWSHEPSSEPQSSTRSKGKTSSSSTPAPATAVVKSSNSTSNSASTSAPRMQAHDALASVSPDGKLAFWVPSLEPSASASAKQSQRNGAGGVRNGRGWTSTTVVGRGSSAGGWVSTGGINTGLTGIRLARCSSAKKTAIVSVRDGVETLSIWDSKESEFASGLEYSHSFMPASPSGAVASDDEHWKIRDLDWTSTGTGMSPTGIDTGGHQESSILAVGFPHRIVLLCQQRMTYFDQEPAWTILGEIDLTKWTPNPIADSIWCAGGTLMVGAGHQIFCFGTPSSAIGYQRLDLVESHAKPSLPEKPTLFERVARVNGPLPDYHPQMLLQCLLWDKVELVKSIIVKLSKAVREAVDNDREGEGAFRWTPIDVNEYFATSQTISQVPAPRKVDYSYLFDDAGNDAEDDGDVFNRALVTSLIELLERKPLKYLSRAESAHLVVLIRTTLQIDEQRRSLDANGLRYLISIRSFYLINNSQAAGTVTPLGTSAAILGGVRHRIRYRDIVWASFSQSQEILLAASTEACGGKMSWKDARALGVFLWLRSTESIKAQAEIVARNQYMAGDDRDPTACCLLYFALGKVKLVHGLWKQAAWHPEQQVMLKFLSNDFETHRWRTAALKNAFALMSKQRFEYAAAFFILGGSLKDAVAVCVKQLKDFQLAVALARIMENGDHGPVFKDILVNTVLPTAFEDGNRWLASWAFWMLHRRDLSVRILVTPLDEMARIAEVQVTDIGHPHYDDPSLALLFMQLKSRSLQTVKGMTEISGRTEFNFVLQMARVFTRMGCHPLALHILAHWSFERVVQTGPPRDERPSASVDEPISPRTARASIRMARAPSLVIDMEIPSAPATRPTSPQPLRLQAAVKPTSTAGGAAPESEGAEVKAQRTGLGSLMKSAKKDVKVAEFDMSAFF